MPDAELDVDVPLVRALLTEQHPDLAGLPLKVAANGWDNVMLRLGDDLAVRLPRRALAAPLVEHEAGALPTLAQRLRAAAPDVVLPVPVRRGRPSDALGYPWSWVVVPWTGGVSAEATPVGDRTAWAGAFGRLLAALHVPAPDDAPPNPVRGVALQQPGRGARPGGPHRAARARARRPAQGGTPRLAAGPGRPGP